MGLLDTGQLESIIKKAVGEVADQIFEKKSEELVHKIRIFVEMSIEKTIDRKLKAMNTEGPQSETVTYDDLQQVKSEILGDLASMGDTVTEILERIDGLELRMEEP